MPFNSNFLGFENLTDFITSQFGLGNVHIHTLFIAVCGAITTFVGSWVFANPVSIFVLWVLMLVDYITGIGKAIIKNEFCSHKMFRMPIYYIVTTGLLSLTFWMSAGSALFILLPTIVLSMFYSIYFVSLLENLGELELLPKPMINILKSRFGLKAIIDKYDKKQDELNNNGE